MIKYLLLSIFSFNCYSVALYEAPGCPENAFCSKDQGRKLLNWKEALKVVTEKNKVALLSKQLLDHGIPTQFLILDKNASPDLIWWNSKCAKHNQKNFKILKAMALLKNSKFENGVFTPVYRVIAGKKRRYHIPYGEHPLYIKNNKVFITREFDSVFFNQSIDARGNWKVEPLDRRAIKNSSLYNGAYKKCPEQIPASPFFSKNLCKEIWNASSKKTELIEIYKTCL